jgi:hypothetical protein
MVLANISLLTIVLPGSAVKPGVWQIMPLVAA